MPEWPAAAPKGGAPHGGGAHAGPVHALCDGKLVCLQSLASGQTLRIFKNGGVDGRGMRGAALSCGPAPVADIATQAHSHSL